MPVQQVAVSTLEISGAAAAFFKSLLTEQPTNKPLPAKLAHSCFPTPSLTYLCPQSHSPFLPGPGLSGRAKTAGQSPGGSLQQTQA